MTATDPELSRRNRRAGLTLVELVVVLVILVALASIVIPRADTAAEQGASDATNATLARLKEVIVNRYMPDTKGAAFVGTTYSGGSGDTTINYDGLPRMGSFNMPPQLVAMFLAPGLSAYNTSSHSGWHGPYITSSTAVFPGANPSTAAARGFLSTSGTSGAFGNAANGTYPGDPTVLDAWGNPIVMVPIFDTSYNQYYYALISAGPSGMLGPAVATYGALQGTSTSRSIPALAAARSIRCPHRSARRSRSIPPGLTATPRPAARVLTITAGTEYYPYWMPLQ